MAGKISIKMLGDKELAARFEQLSSQVQRKIVKPALQEGADYIKLYAHMMAARRTGNMANSIFVEPLTKKGVVGFKVSTGSRMLLGIPADAKYYYPAAIEFGTENMPARPFMRPATYDNEQLVYIKIGDALREAVEKKITAAYKKGGNG
jgi:HK97 gp10 family phage protein